jgi:hypothetical protein
MKGKLIVFLTGIFFSVFLVSYLILFAQPAPQKYELVIMKVGSEWKVVDATDYTKTKVRVRKKDTIVWTAKGTDASLQFPDNLFNPVDAEDSLHNGYTKFLKKGKKLKLRVKESVLAGTYEYAVFCIADGVFARGDSPPKIIIE